MTPGDFLSVVIEPALRLLPERMDTNAARAMLVAAALQETDLLHRRQIGGGRATSYFQFEPPSDAGRVAITGVLIHPATAEFARDVCSRLDYPADGEVIHAAVEHNYILAAAIARLLLWTLPERLPLAIETEMAWRQYCAAWNPGKPRPERWNTRYARAWNEVMA